MKKCPLCNSKLTEYTETKVSEIGWEDGLGSPGRIIFSTDWLVCTKCSFRVLPKDYKQV